MGAGPAGVGAPRGGVVRANAPGGLCGSGIRISRARVQARALLALYGRDGFRGGGRGPGVPGSGLMRWQIDGSSCYQTAGWRRGPEADSTGHMTCAEPVSEVATRLDPTESARSLSVGQRWPAREGTPAHRGPISHLPGREAEEDCMQSLWRSFWSDESGQGLVEYALIIALVAVGLIAILLVLRNSIGNVFNNAATQLNNAPANPYP